MTAILLSLALQAVVAASDGWIAAPAAGATSTPAYVTIQNPTMYDVYVVSASTDVAGKIELREGGKTVTSLTASSFGSTELKADGPSLMLMDLKRPLKVGETIELTLKTDGGITLKVPCVIKNNQ